MKKEVFEKVLSIFPMAKHRGIGIAGLPFGDWFLIEASPLPLLNELPLVISDINKDSEIALPPDLMVRHSGKCKNQDHVLTEILDNAIKRLDRQVFRIAIWEGHPTVLNGQPVAIPLEPEISYHMYPDHPHLNIGSTVIKKFHVPESNIGAEYKDYYLPDSICYTHDVTNLGTDPYDRISEAIFEVSLWLLRHQIWVETRELGYATWIGPGFDNPEHRRNVSKALNPLGQCHCRSGKAYQDCHMKHEYQSFYGINSSQVKTMYNINRWINDRDIPHRWTLQELRRLLKSPS